MERYAIVANVRGPWQEAIAWLKTVATREITWLKEYATPGTPRPFQPLSQSSPAEHITLYEKFSAASDYLLPRDAELLQSTLWHWDLHASNIFVTEDKITAVIDWQDCWVGPLMLQARRPPLVDFKGKRMLQFPDHYKSLDAGPEKDKIRDTVERSILLFIYESELHGTSPVFGRLSHVPHVSMIKETVLFSANTWDNGIIPFRESLIRIQKHWSEICPDHPCPFTFTADELEKHAVESEGYDENAEFWSSISGLVARDGFVLVEDYEEAFELFAGLREEGLRVFVGREREDFEKATGWAVPV
ncbi:hypothetical protein LTR62_007946 [Meristemomyces frigidus]|uniref:Altered inheritance of mitochondria protein 9, mitochondrial n=1 Tax=Meristemomyces frigidus TaxID=1508187 RepID=A0AAN7YR95_9PEZI|nr:hypothetical protein LTR62_007946 [Meristemomyces frigidus]